MALPIARGIEVAHLTHQMGAWDVLEHPKGAFVGFSFSIVLMGKRRELMRTITEFGHIDPKSLEAPSSTRLGTARSVA